MSARLIDQYPIRRLSGAGAALLATLSLSACNGVGSASETFGEGQYDVAVTCPPRYEENVETVDLVQNDNSSITIDCRFQDSVRPPTGIRQVHPPLIGNNIFEIGYSYGEYGKQHPQINVDPSDGVVATITFSDISQVTLVSQNRALQN